MSLGSLTAAQGFYINGETPFDFSGNSVASAGDFNGDGFGDVIGTRWRKRENWRKLSSACLAFCDLGIQRATEKLLIYYLKL